MIKYLHIQCEFVLISFKALLQAEMNILTYRCWPFDILWLMKGSLAYPWQLLLSSTYQCQVTISPLPPLIILDITNDYTLCVNENVHQEVSWYEVRVVVAWLMIFQMKGGLQ